MAQQQPIRVVVEKKPSGCWDVLAVMLLLGLAIEYWYVSLAIVAIVASGRSVPRTRSRRSAEKAAHQPGPRDPWLNEVAVALADLGLKEIARNTGAQLGGAPIDGDIGLQAERFLVYVTLFSDQRLARQAELGLRAKPEVRDAIAKGATAVRTEDRVVFVANGAAASSTSSASTRSFASSAGWRCRRRCRRHGAANRRRPGRATAGAGSRSPDPDVLEQLRKLGELRRPAC